LIYFHLFNFLKILQYKASTLLYSQRLIPFLFECLEIFSSSNIYTGKSIPRLEYLKQLILSSLIFFRNFDEFSSTSLLPVTFELLPVNLTVFLFKFEKLNF